MSNGKTLGYKNVGISDRVLRIVLGLIFVMFYITGIADGTIGTVIIIIGVILVLTAVIRVCPMYMIFGISTCKLDRSSKKRK